MLEIECRETNDAMLVELVGRMVGGSETNALRETIKSKVESGHRKFILAMAKLEWMNSTGIGVLVEVYVSVKRAGGFLVLLSPTERVVHTLETTKLIPCVFKVVENEADAAKRFVSDGPLESAEAPG